MTAAERGLEAMKARQAEIEADIRTSLVDTEAVLQKSMEALESKRNAQESEHKARSEADQEVLALWG